MTAPLIVVGGVAGCGKTTLAAALAQALGLGFRDGDDLHPEANKAKMAAGKPLTDADRDGRDVVVAWMHDLGLEVVVDAVGNIIGTWAVSGSA